MLLRCLLLAAVCANLASVGRAVEPRIPEQSVRRPGSVTAFFAGWSPAERKIYDALADVTTVNFADTPLIDCVEYISRQHNIPIILNVAELEENGILIDEPINLVLTGVTLRSTLRIMLHGLKLDVMVSNDILVVTTRDHAAGEATTRTYPVRDLIVPDHEDAWDELIDAVCSAAGTTWDHKDNSDRTIVAVPSLGTLVVSQNQYGHESVVRLLDALRGAHVSDGLKSDRQPSGYLPFDRTTGVLEAQSRWKYLTVTPILVVKPESRREIGVTLAKNRYEVKDKLQVLLAEMSPEEVQTTAGYQAAKKEIETFFNSFLVTEQAPRIQGVLFDGWQLR